MLHKLIKFFKSLFHKSRKNWDKAFEQYVQEGDDELMI